MEHNVITRSNRNLTEKSEALLEGGLSDLEEIHQFTPTVTSPSTLFPDLCLNYHESLKEMECIYDCLCSDNGGDVVK